MRPGLRSPSHGTDAALPAATCGTTEPRSVLRILLPDLLRRVAVLTIVSAIGIAALTPLAVRSAMPQSAVPERLLAAAEEAPASVLRRAATDGRELSAALTLLQAARPIGVETLGTGSAAAPSLPPIEPMQATLYVRPTPPPPAPDPEVVTPPPAGDSVTGKATWYCCSLGWRGEAVVALPGALGGHYDAPPASRTVTVCADRCVELPVVDYCGCHWGTSAQKVADLSPEAWAAVSNAGLSAGVITVTVHL